MYAHAEKSGDIGQKPADGDRQPDSGRTEVRGEQICQSYPQPQGNDGQHDRHIGSVDGTVVAVEQEQTADPAVACAFDLQIPDSRRDDGRLLCTDEDLHQRSCKEHDGGGNHEAEADGEQKCLSRPAADPFAVLCAVVLGNEGGIGIAEILNRQVCKGVDFHGCCKGGHDGRPEAVDQSLDHQDAEVHDRLLDTGHGGETEDALQDAAAEAEFPAGREHAAAAQEHVAGDADGGEILGDDGGQCGSGDTPGKACDEQEIQRDIEKR